MISDGARVTQGTSAPNALPGLVGAPDKAAQPGQPRFDRNDFQSGKLGEHAFGDHALQLAFERRRLRHIILDVIRRPSDRRRCVAIGAPRHAHRSAIPAAPPPIDRPELAPAQRDLARHQHQHLHEPVIVGAPFDFGYRHLGIVGGNDDRRAQPRITAQPRVANPIVGRAAKHRRHVLAVHDLGAIQAVENAKSRLIAIQHVRLHGLQRRPRFSVLIEFPVGATGKRRVLGIAGEAEVQAVERPHRNHFAQ